MGTSPNMKLPFSLLFFQNALAQIALSGQSSSCPPAAQLISNVGRGMSREQQIKDLLLGKPGYEPVDINAVNYMKRSALFVACQKVDIPMVEFLTSFAKNQESVGTIDFESKDYWGNTALNMIARAPPKPYGHDDQVTDWPLKRRMEYAYHIMRILIDSGADVNSANDNGATPLITAAGVGFADAIDLLAESGADINYRIEAPEGSFSRFRGFSALDIAVKQRNYLKSVGKGTVFYG